MDEHWKQKIDSLEQLVVAGKGLEARSIIQEYDLKKIPRSYKYNMANLARRSGLTELSLKILNPVVRSDKIEFDPPSKDEKIEYATGLIWIGAPREALELINEVSDENFPRALLVTAFAHFSNWGYAKAIPYLETYIMREDIDDYQRVVGKVNLLDSYIYVGDNKARKLANDLLKITKKNEYTLLHGICLELTAQFYITHKNYDKAEFMIGKAIKHLKKTGSLNQFFSQKWAAIIQFLQGAPATVLEDIKKLALENREWETVRQCDLYLSKHTDDPFLLNFLYYGTPFESYKEIVLKFTEKKDQLQSEFLWTPGSWKNSSNQNVFNLDKCGDLLKPGQLIHRLLTIFTKDFYKPLSIPFIHSELFPDEYYNPNSSVTRVNRAMNRLRHWIEDNELPLILEVTNGQYKLSTNENFSILLKLEDSPNIKNSFEVQLGDLRKFFSTEKYFTTKDISLQLNSSPRTASRFIKRCISEGVVRVENKGPKARYRFEYFNNP